MCDESDFFMVLEIKTGGGGRKWENVDIFFDKQNLLINFHSSRLFLRSHNCFLCYSLLFSRFYSKYSEIAVVLAMSFCGRDREYVIDLAILEWMF